MNKLRAKLVDVVIPTKHWARGKLLKRGDRDRACVLGHVALACGIPPGRLRGYSNYNHLSKEERDKLPKLLRLNSTVSATFVYNLMVLNDEGVNRQERLIPLLRHAGVRLHFVESLREGAEYLTKLWGRR